MFISVL